MKRQQSVLSKIQRPVLMVAAVALLLLLLQWNPLGMQPGQRAQLAVQEVKEVDAARQQPQTSGMKFLDISSVEAILEVPTDCVGVLFVAHGCGHAATDFWRSGAACPQCLGLPEEVNITSRALARGYAVLAVSSADRSGPRCWGAALPSEPSVDMVQVRDVLRQLDSESWPQLQGKPQYALGASSGGAFVLALAALHPLAAVVSQIMAVPEALLRAPPVPPGRKYPPAMFVHMPRDVSTAERVQQNLDTLRAMGVATQEVRIEPAPVTAAWLQHKLGLGAEVAAQLHASFRQANILDGGDMLVQSPRSSPWRAAIGPDLLGGGLQGMSLEADASPLAEVLNVAFAGHEIVSDTTDATIDWFEAHTAAAAQGNLAGSGGH